MKQQDDRILEQLREEGWASASLIASKPSIDISEGHVDERLQMLQYAGLVGQIWSGAYEITQDGIMYLDGDLDVAHQPRPTVGRVLR
jgi:fructosamine-3-kinase